jgi:hypothetical protein
LLAEAAEDVRLLKSMRQQIKGFRRSGPNQAAGRFRLSHRGSKTNL